MSSCDWPIPPCFITIAPGTGAGGKKNPPNGLEQAVNSLRAQRKASEEFARSQHGKGWCLVKDRLR
jgi:hypothetical protein